MSQKLKTIKVTEATTDCIKSAAFVLGKKQYEVAETAAQLYWEKVEKKSRWKLEPAAKYCKSSKKSNQYGK